MNGLMLGKDGLMPSMSRLMLGKDRFTLSKDGLRLRMNGSTLGGDRFMPSMKAFMQSKVFPGEAAKRRDPGAARRAPFQGARRPLTY